MVKLGRPKSYEGNLMRRTYAFPSDFVDYLESLAEATNTSQTKILINAVYLSSKKKLIEMTAKIIDLEKKLKHLYAQNKLVMECDEKETMQLLRQWFINNKSDLHHKLSVLRLANRRDIITLEKFATIQLHRFDRDILIPKRYKLNDKEDILRYFLYLLHTNGFKEVIS